MRRSGAQLADRLALLSLAWLAQIRFQLIALAVDRSVGRAIPAPTDDDGDDGRLLDCILKEGFNGACSRPSGKAPIALTRPEEEWRPSLAS